MTAEEERGPDPETDEPAVDDDLLTALAATVGELLVAQPVEDAEEPGTEEA